MPKTVLLSKFQEWKGLDRISLIVHDMKCIFREITKDDFGLDGEIEVVIPKSDGNGFETTGGIIKVQAKSGESYVKQDKDTSFSTPVDKNDLEDWHKATFPVLFIVYHPKDDKLYFKEIKAYVRNTPSIFQPPLRIVFDKATDEFNTNVYERICQAAAVSPSRISRDQREKLYSNLLIVKRGPKVITYAPTSYKDYTHVRNEVRGFAPPFTVTGGCLYTLADLIDNRCVLRGYCDINKINDMPSSKWAKDELHRSDYVFLLNQLLGSHLRRCGLVYNRDFRRNYFPRQDDTGQVFKETWYNVRTGRAAPARIVAKYYKYGLARFWRHLAVNLSFKYIGTSWFLQLDPKYFFTIDGETPCDSDLVGPYTTGIKATERNNHVLNHVLFWTDILSLRKPVIELSLFHKTVMTIEKEPLSGIATFAIPNDPAIYEEESGQLDFFRWHLNWPMMVRMMSIKLEYLGEPKLQFGHYFEHEDTKTGLAEFGPFGKNIPGLHPAQIKLGFIGTRETISGAKEWIETCGSAIESENIKKVGTKAKSEVEGLFNNEDQYDLQLTRYEKILNRDFIGFNRESPFQCEFQTNERWEKPIISRDIDEILNIEDKEARIWALVDLFESNIKTLSQTSPSPDIIILALTPEIVEQAHAVRISGNFFLNFRRAIKAKSMRWDIPIQLLQRRTVTGKGPELQERATRAWNFCTAQYYKADGIPWRPITLERDVCFIGVSFYVTRDVNEKLTMRSSVAQAFDYMGQGLVLRGDPFEWDEEKPGLSPHLTRVGAHKLIRDTLQEYLNLADIPPRRVVIHKTSEYWGHEHGEYNELDGLLEGIQEISPRCDSDLLSLRQTGLRLFREGSYPPLRGTYFSIEDAHHFLFTMGYIPYLETYPGSYVPEPWQITEHHGSSAPKDLLKEILALTKMGSGEVRWDATRGCNDE